MTVFAGKLPMVVVYTPVVVFLVKVAEPTAMGAATFAYVVPFNVYMAAVVLFNVPGFFTLTTTFEMAVGAAFTSRIESCPELLAEQAAEVGLAV